MTVFRHVQDVAQHTFNQTTAWYLADAFDGAVRDKDLGTYIVFEKDSIKIYTRMTRDWRRSSNDGDYTYWTVFFNNGIDLIAQHRCTCDFWQPQDESERIDGSAKWIELVAFIKTLSRIYGIQMTIRGDGI